MAADTPDSTRTGTVRCRPGPSWWIMVGFIAGLACLFVKFVILPTSGSSPQADAACGCAQWSESENVALFAGLWGLPLLGAFWLAAWMLRYEVRFGD